MSYLPEISERRVALAGLALAAAGTVVLRFAAHISVIFAATRDSRAVAAVSR